MKPTSSKGTLALCILLALGGATAPSVAWAQPSATDIAEARELLNAGLDLREKGDPAGALEKLRGAHALANTPVTGIELGRTYVALGKLVEARETFLSIARIPPRPEETPRSKAARNESEVLAGQLRERIPTLAVRVTGVPVETVSVAVDGATVPSEALAAPRLLNPGTHTVFARSTTGGTAETQVTLKEREAREVELRIAFSPSAPPSSPGAAAPLPAGAPGVPAAALSPVATDQGSEARPRSHALDWSLVGAGAAIAVAGAIVMGVEAGQAGDANNRQDRPAYDAAKNVWIGGLVGVIAGGTVTASGLVLFAATAQAKPATAKGGKSLQLNLGINGVRLGGTW